MTAHSHAKSKSAESTSRNVAKYREAGLIQAKVWTHPDETPAVRDYAAEQPKTKAIREKL